MFKNPDFRGVTPVYLMHVEAKEAVTAETNEKSLLYVKSNEADAQPVSDPVLSYLWFRNDKEAHPCGL